MFLLKQRNRVFSENFFVLNTMNDFARTTIIARINEIKSHHNDEYISYHVELICIGSLPQVGFTPLHLAASQGCKGILDSMIQHGADLNKQCKVEIYRGISKYNVAPRPLLHA